MARHSDSVFLARGLSDEAQLQIRRPRPSTSSAVNVFTGEVHGQVLGRILFLQTHACLVLIIEAWRHRGTVPQCFPLPANEQQLM